VSRRRLAFGLAALAAALVSSCAERKPAEPMVELRPVGFADLAGWPDDDPGAALAAFRRSCEVLARRAPGDRMGREPWAGTVGDWRPACAEAEGVAPGAEAARDFLERSFVPAAITDRGQPEGLFTGYYELLLHGSRSPDARYRVPLHRRPPELVAVDLGDFDEALSGRRIAGRVVDGRLRPYPSRAEIDAGSLAGRGLELLWVDDPIGKFFLQIQGSGLVELPDGQRLRIGYADQNGRAYRAIGRDLVEMGELDREAVSLQTIRGWLRAHPDRAPALMERNPSYVFFREHGDAATTPGPLGAQNVALTPERSIAVDRRFVPLGVPLWLDTMAPYPEGECPFRRLVVAQDTGGAITGPVRGDVFWGSGELAEHVAGHMQSRGRWFVLLPRGLAPSS
jgi:membrane-bound lytic murein transglycosylase A